MTMKRFLLYPVRLLAFAAVLLWDSIIPRRKLPAYMRVVNNTGRRLHIHYDFDERMVIVSEPPDLETGFRLYQPEGVGCGVISADGERGD